MLTLTAQLPDEGGLRAAASALRGTGDTLAGQASVTRGVAEGIGPAVWNDDASGNVRSLLQELADELGAGGSAMHQSASALEALAGYVSGQRWRYEETGRQLEALARDPLGDVDPGKLAEATRLLEERNGIEWGVRAAMGQAGDVINQATALATRYHSSGGKSVWSRIGHFFADLGSGAWDGTYEMGKGLLGLAVTLAKLSPLRAEYDPIGYAHDLAHAERTFTTDAYAIAHNKKAFAENLLNLKELKSDPVHWAGELVPSIALAFASGGLGLGAKGADGIEAVDATAAATETSGRLSETALVNQEDFSLYRYEKIAGDSGTPGHTYKLHLNVSDQSNADYIRGLGRPTDGLWTSPEIADEAAKLVLPRVSGDIEQYLADPGGDPLKVEVSFNEPIGIALHSGDPTIRISDKAIFVIRPASSMPEGFSVETAYPVYDPSAPAYIP